MHESDNLKAAGASDILARADPSTGDIVDPNDPDEYSAGESAGEGDWRGMSLLGSPPVIALSDRVLEVPVSIPI
jgi:hypothetical protein